MYKIVYFYSIIDMENALNRLAKAKWSCVSAYHDGRHHIAVMREDR